MNFFLFFSVLFIYLFILFRATCQKPGVIKLLYFVIELYLLPSFPFISPHSLCLVLPLSLLRLLWEMYRLPSSREKMSRQSWQDGPFALPYGSVGRPSFLPFNWGYVFVQCASCNTHFISLVPFGRLAGAPTCLVPQDKKSSVSGWELNEGGESERFQSFGVQGGAVPIDDHGNVT